MSQYEVYNLLKKHPNKWFSTKEISKQFKINTGNVNANLLKLKKSGDVIRKQEKFCMTLGYLWKFKE